MDLFTKDFVLDLWKQSPEFAAVIILGVLAYRILSVYLPIYAEKTKARWNAAKEHEAAQSALILKLTSDLTNHLSSVVPILEGLRGDHAAMKDVLEDISDALGGHHAGSD